MAQTLAYDRQTTAGRGLPASERSSEIVLPEIASLETGALQQLLPSDFEIHKVARAASGRKNPRGGGQKFSPARNDFDGLRS